MLNSSSLVAELIIPLGVCSSTMSLLLSPLLPTEMKKKHREIHKSRVTTIACISRNESFWGFAPSSNQDYNNIARNSSVQHLKEIKKLTEHFVNTILTILLQMRQPPIVPRNLLTHPVELLQLLACVKS